MERKKSILLTVGIIVICVVILAVIYIMLSGTITEADEDREVLLVDYPILLTGMMVSVVIVIVLLFIRKGGEEIQN